MIQIFKTKRVILMKVMMNKKIKDQIITKNKKENLSEIENY